MPVQNPNIGVLPVAYRGKNGPAVSTVVTIPNQSGRGLAATIQNPPNSSVDPTNESPSLPQPATNSNNGLKVESKGEESNNGGLNSNSAAFPNVYYNIKNYDYSTSNLKFKFATDTLVDDSTSTDRWLCDVGLKGGECNLIGDAGCLHSVSSYGKYFYELQYNKSITNNSFLQYPSFAPSYTVLVFAIANTATTSDIYLDFEKILKTCRIHKFVQAGSITSSDPSFNFGLIPKLMTGKVINFGKGQFVAGNLNSSKYILDYNQGGLFQSKQGGSVKLNPNSYTEFISRGGRSLGYGDTYTYIEIPPFNLYNLPTDLATPTIFKDVVVTKNGTSTNYKNFCMFFVEMRSYVSTEFRTVTSNNVIFETYINGVLVFRSGTLIARTIETSGMQNYILELSNKSNDATDPGNKLFLFDYLHGSAYNVEGMVNESRNYTFSLASRYRNILVKGTSDLQICNSQTTLSLPITYSHPFNRMFLASKTK